MRSIITIVVCCIFATTALANSTAKGNSNTYLSTFEINKTGENLYELTYANTAEKFTIEVCPEETRCCYLVRNEHFEAMYLCSKNGFGLRKMPDKLQKVSLNTYSKYLDVDAFANQSVLTPKKKTKTEALEIIACFLPLVVKSDSREIVFNRDTQVQPMTSLR